MLEPSKAAELYHPSVTRVVAYAALLQPISPTKSRIAHAFTWRVYHAVQRPSRDTLAALEGGLENAFAYRHYPNLHYPVYVG